MLTRVGAYSQHGGICRNAYMYVHNIYSYIYTIHRRMFSKPHIPIFAMKMQFAPSWLSLDINTLLTKSRLNYSWYITL